MFSTSKVLKDLQKLSSTPVDLPSAMSKERIEKMQSLNAGWKLSYATERVDEEVIQTLFQLAHDRNALDLMQQMQLGKCLNQIEGFTSEKKSVLHTATRDFFKDQLSSKEADSARRGAYEEVEKLERFVQLMEEREWSDIIQIGIGGSSLGPKAIYQSLRAHQKKPVRVHFLSNIDPDSASKILQEVHLETTLVISVSKSGTTLETCQNEERIRNAFASERIDPQGHFLAVTAKGSPMDNPAHYLAIFYIWDFIGGRFSATSMVGGVVLSLALGFDMYWKLLEGAQAMDRVARSSVNPKNLPLMGALLGIWNRNFLHHASLALIPYAEGLAGFPAHVQQLDMESNGKQIDRQGNFLDFPAGEILFGDVGTDCQHSFFQFLHQGCDIVPIAFIGVVKDQYGKDLELEGTSFQEKLLANLFAQMIALAQGQKSENPNQLFLGNRPSHLLLTEVLDPYRVGALLAYFEHKIAFQGFIWGVNSFDQEGVQLGKKLSNQMMDGFRCKKSMQSFSSPIIEACLDLTEDFL